MRNGRADTLGQAKTNHRAPVHQDDARQADVNAFVSWQRERPAPGQPVLPGSRIQKEPADRRMTRPQTTRIGS